MKYYIKNSRGELQLIVNTVEITRLDKVRKSGGALDQHVYAIPNVDELKKGAIDLIGSVATSRSEAKQALIEELKQSNRIKDVYHVLMNTYKTILPSPKSMSNRYFQGDGMLAKSIRMVFSQLMYMDLSNQLNSDGSVSVRARLSGIRSVLFEQDQHATHKLSLRLQSQRRRDA